MLAAGTVAQASFSTITVGLPAIAPALREHYDLGLQGVGVFLAAVWAGLTLSLFPWGLATDRIGERRALAFGLAACGVLLATLALVGDVVQAGLLLALAVGVGGSVQSASGRAVMQWFDADERGFAFGVRQMAVPAGGLTGALALPALADARGVPTAFVCLGAFCVVTAAIGYAVVRELPSEGVHVDEVESVLRERELWVLCAGSALYVTAQIVLISFLVLYLHDERGFSAGGAAAVLGAANVVAMALRIGAGRWSDVRRSRIVPLRRIGVGTTAAFAAAAVLLGSPDVVVVPLLVVATALSAAWNGLAFVAAAELAGSARSGAAIGMQQTALSVPGVVIPPAFAAVVGLSSWRAGFALAAVAPLAGWMLLGRLR